MILKTQSISGKFGITISDFILKNYSGDNPPDEYKLQTGFKHLKNFMNIVIQTDIEEQKYPNVQKLIGHTMIKYYLQSYTKIIYLR